MIGEPPSNSRASWSGRAARLTAGAALVAMAGCGGPTAAPPETQSRGQRAQEASAVSWDRFRGPNGSGVADDAGPLPTRFDPDTNVVWTTPLPPGH